LLKINIIFFTCYWLSTIINFTHSLSTSHIVSYLNTNIAFLFHIRNLSHIYKKSEPLKYRKEIRQTLSQPY